MAVDQQNVKIPPPVLCLQGSKLWELCGGRGIGWLVEVVAEVDLGQDEHGLRPGVSQRLQVRQDMTLRQVVSVVAGYDPSRRGLWLGLQGKQTPAACWQVGLLTDTGSVVAELTSGGARWWVVTLHKHGLAGPRSGVPVVGHLVEVLWWHGVGALEGIRVQRSYEVTPHDLSVLAKLRCYTTWPGYVYDVTPHGLAVSVKLRCYATWPGCVSKVTMLWHMARVYQRSHDVMTHGQGVSQCYGTWPGCVSKVMMLWHMAWVYQ